jgi:hypothetical protein
MARRASSKSGGTGVARAVDMDILLVQGVHRASPVVNLASRTASYALRRCPSGRPRAV